MCALNDIWCRRFCIYRVRFRSEYLYSNFCFFIISQRFLYATTLQKMLYKLKFVQQLSQNVEHFAKRYTGEFVPFIYKCIIVVPISIVDYSPVEWIIYQICCIDRDYKNSTILTKNELHPLLTYSQRCRQEKISGLSHHALFFILTKATSSRVHTTIGINARLSKSLSRS